jgi:hypothetical protein
MRKLTEGLHAAKRAVELLRNLTRLVETVPAYRMDLGIALREQGQLLAASGDIDACRKPLAESKQVLSQLLQEHPSSDRYAAELGLTIDVLAGLEGNFSPTKSLPQPPTKSGNKPVKNRKK